MTSDNPPSPEGLGADPRRRFLQLSGWLDRQWYAANADADLSGHADVIEHYLTHGAQRGIAPNDFLQAVQEGRVEPPGGTSSVAPKLPPENDRQLELEVELIRSSGLFDNAFYGRQLDAAGIKVRRGRRLLHFCRAGWRNGLRPSSDFDVWWYWTTHLDPRLEAVNPLVHYVLIGRDAGLSPMPVTVPRSSGGTASREPASPTAGRRRICLFAGYDLDGVVDDYVVEYVRELSRFADVYYLSDGYLDDHQLARLEGITRGAWGIRHAAYDFGSWSMLARELVGWDLIEQYDELLLVNDSCYLLKPLDEVFARMDARECDWWGMQATKGMAATRDVLSNSFTQPVPMSVVKDQLGSFDEDEIYDFHVGSYFLAYRRSVIDDEHFRRLLDSVHRQRTKFTVILKYEVGITRYLVGRGHDFDTFVDALYPFHPIFTGWYFELLERGFPLLKKFLLYQNVYDVPDLALWKERVRAVVPGAPVEMFEHNLVRTAPRDRLERSFAITSRPDGTVDTPGRRDDDEFELLDESTPTLDHWWAFVVSWDTHDLPDNSRAIFEQVRHDPTIKKVILTTSRAVDLDGENVVTMSLINREAEELLVRCRFVFVSERPLQALRRRPLSFDLHDVILVRDTLRLQRFHHAVKAFPPVRRAGRQPLARILTASDVDHLVMLAGHYIVDYLSGWRTGLPAHDFVVSEHDALPQDLQAAETRLREQLGGRRLVLFTPAEGRSTAETAYRFSDEEIEWLRSWTERHGLVLGLREHAKDTQHTYLARLAGVVMNLPPHEHPHLPVLLRVADAVLTDFSGVALDFMVTRRPVVSFVHDLDEVAPNLFLDLSRVMPGAVCRDFSQLARELEGLFEPPDDVARHRYERSRRLFLDQVDGHAAERVVDLVRAQHRAEEPS